MFLSRTSSGVIDYTFNYSSIIYILKSKVTLSNFSFEVHNAVANFLTLDKASTSSGIPNSGTDLQAYSIIVTRFWHCVHNSSYSFRTSVFSMNSYWLLTWNSLIVMDVCFSLILSSSMIPWCNARRDSSSSMGRFNPISFTKWRTVCCSSVSMRTDPSDKEKTLTSRG